MGEYDDLHYDPPTPRKQVALEGEIKRLRAENAKLREILEWFVESGEGEIALMEQAADEIERLRERVTEAENRVTHPGKDLSTDITILRQVRNQALEEAAKVAETCGRKWRAASVAAAIRALKVSATS